MACRVFTILILATLVAVSSGANCFSLLSHIPNQYCQINCNDPVNPFCPPDYCTCGTAPTPTSLTCSSPLSFLGIDDWCTQNCNAIPSFCPPVICFCVDSATGNPGDLPVPLNCTSKSQPVTATWCNDNCGTYCPFKFCDCGYPVNNYQSTCTGLTDEDCVDTCNTFGGFCPTDCCTEVAFSASPTPSPDTVPINIFADDQDSCCSAGGHKVFVVQQGDVYLGEIFPDNEFAFDANSATLCADTANVVSIAVDSDGGAYVADSEAGQVIYIDPSCDPTLNVVVADRLTTQILTPTTISIVAGGLVVGTMERNVFAFGLNDQRRVISSTLVDVGARQINQLRTYNGQTYILFSSYVVAFSDGSTLVDIFTAGDFRASTFIDINVSNCGLYALSSSGQLIRCSDPLDKASCEFVCGQFVNTCRLQSPGAISVDCDCNAYISNTGGSSIVIIEGTNSTRYEPANLQFPTALNVFSDPC